MLVADDDPLAAQVLGRALDRAGYAVTAVASGHEAAREVQQISYDAIVSDIDMPGMTGIELLQAVRQLDYEVAIILVTGSPSLDTAVRAVEHGAVRYLTKPVDHDELVSAVDYAVKVSRLAHLKRLALSAIHATAAGDAVQVDEAARFARGLDQVWMAYQPIISCQSRGVFAYEALLRTRETSYPHPGAFLSSAENLGRVHELGRIIRAQVAEAIPRLPGAERMFVNLHPMDLQDDSLFHPDSPLSRYAGRVVLEITERASLSSVHKLSQRLADLRSLGFETAVDDLGSGYAGLSSFVLLDPDIVKLDMSLIRGIDRNPRLERIVGSILELARSLGVRTVVEGVETVLEASALAPLGPDFMQGYLFARPQPEFVTIAPDAQPGGVTWVP